jgi:hypothetical protein
MMSPKRSQVSPLNLWSFSCDSGAKSVALVFTLMPGSRLYSVERGELAYSAPRKWFSVAEFAADDVAE